MWSVLMSKVQSLTSKVRIPSGHEIDIMRRLISYKAYMEILNEGTELPE